MSLSDCDIHVVNCDNNKKKFKYFKQVLKGHKVKRFSCFYAKDYTDNFFCHMVEKKMISEDASLNKIEVAIALSHYLIWYKFLETSDKEYCLVLEDDAELKEGFEDNIGKLLQIEKFDIIFCRNVMIYFDDALKKRVLDLLYNSLKDDGYLIILRYYARLWKNQVWYLRCKDKDL